ncbi:hypothetical protein [Knoellia sinensis]|uniref:hypothetical protein n=1 Tax=Knoellia sinensis TaxID=136100 RepID=UPI000A6F319F|nr:hypothetical protein [Knoellia sinensis]
MLIADKDTRYKDDASGQHFVTGPALGAARWALGAGRRAPGAARWALGAGRWALGAGSAG